MRRQRLIHAQAAYQFEVERLGKVIQLLQERPSDFSETILLEAMNKSYSTSSSSTPKSSKPPRFHLQNFQFPQDLWAIPKNYKFPARLVSQIGTLLGTDTVDSSELSKELSIHILFQHHAQDTQWMADATNWIRQARQLLGETVRDSLLKSTIEDESFSLPEWETIDWSQDLSAEQWGTVLRYVHAQSSWRRLGESRVVRLGDAAIVHWTKRLNYRGIPGYLASLWVANIAHHRIKPHWPFLKKQGLEIAGTALTIFKTRVWEPFTNLVDEIMNRSKGIMSAMGLDEEQTSLDHMLRDMGFGDGTAASRDQALQQAARQYEHDLASGVFVNLARGRLVRLLLIQVQQLKVGLLSALDTIDVLMKGNRIHFQILAFIPAVWITVYGTRFFIRSLYNIRAKDLRPVRLVHGEMSLYLDHLERIILLSDVGATGLNSGSTVDSALSIRQTGELHLYVYRYLVLLDYSCPPFPSTRCDQLHLSLQDLLNSPSNVAWLQSIQRKHQDLIKHI